MNSFPRPLAYGLAALAIALPWLNPFAFGPSPAVTQTLLTMLGAAALLLLLALRQLTGSELARAAALGWLVAALLSSVIGLLQYFGFSATFVPWVNSTELGEAFANLRQRNQFATLTNIGLAVLLWWTAQRPTKEADAAYTAHTLRVPAALWWLMAALLALGNATTSSRTGAAQLVALALCVGIWMYRDRKSEVQRTTPMAWQLLLFAVAIYAAALWLLPRLAGLDAVTQGALAHFVDGNSACGGRRTLWGNVLYLIAQKPWLGWGWGELSYAHYITLYPGLRFCDILDNAHDLPLQLAVELGVPVAVLLCGAALVLIVRARPWRERDPAKRMAWGVLAMILLHSMVEYPLWYAPFLMAAILCLVLLSRSRSAVGQDAGAASTEVYAPLAAACTACVMLAAVGYTAWDYDRVNQIFLAPTERAPAYRYDTLAKLQGSWIFRKHVRYAELTTTTVTRDNAAKVHALALELLHFSPEARVLEKLIESDAQLGLDEESLFHMQRFRAAFPDEYAQWLKTGAEPLDAEPDPPR